MPPAPMGARISFAPTRFPEVSVNEGWIIAPRNINVSDYLS
jgi:hypothetical protein